MISDSSSTTVLFLQRNKSPDSSLPSGSIMSENDSVESPSSWREF